MIYLGVLKSWLKRERVQIRDLGAEKTYRVIIEE